MFHCPNILMLKITIECSTENKRNNNNANASTLQHKHLETNALLKRTVIFVLFSSQNLYFVKVLRFACAVSDYSRCMLLRFIE